MKGASRTCNAAILAAGEVGMRGVLIGDGRRDQRCACTEAIASQCQWRWKMEIEGALLRYMRRIGRIGALAMERTAVSER